MIDKKAILRKYFHGLTDEQFAEDISTYPLGNVFGAMDECIRQACEQQRKLCNKAYCEEPTGRGSNISKAILNAPEPELK